MPNGNLDTTNTLLAIMAVVSVLEAVVLIGFGIGGFMMYRRTMQLVGNLETRQIAPLREKVDAILEDVRAVTADVKAVSARVSQQTERVDHALSDTMDRVDETAERVRSTVRERVHHAVAVASGLRAVIMSIFGKDSGQEPAAARRAG